MVVEERVVPIRKVLKCDKCGTEMEIQPYALCSDPPQYDYICPKCGATERHSVVYPYIEYVQFTDPKYQ